MRLAVPAVSDRLRRLWSLDEPPWRIALAVAVGVFIGCTPFWFFQTVLALLVAALFRLPKLATVTGVWLNLPWIAPFVYAGALHVGGLVVGQRQAPGEALRALLAAPDLVGRGDAAALAHEMSIALLIGTTLVGLAAAGIAFVVVFLVVRARRPATVPSAAPEPPRVS